MVNEENILDAEDITLVLERLASEIIERHHGLPRGSGGRYSRGRPPHRADHRQREVALGLQVAEQPEREEVDDRIREQPRHEEPHVNLALGAECLVRG